jgi:hypothetical protein
MRYQREKHRLVANFSGGKGVFTFDLRKGKCLDYYDLHYYPISDFDLCNEQLTNHAVSLFPIKFLGYCWYNIPYAI